MRIEQEGQLQWLAPQARCWLGAIISFLCIESYYMLLPNICVPSDLKQIPHQKYFLVGFFFIFIFLRFSLFLSVAPRNRTRSFFSLAIPLERGLANTSTFRQLPIARTAKKEMENLLISQELTCCLEDRSDKHRRCYKSP